MSILYINFCPNETIVWDIDKINNEVKTLVANKATSISRDEKINKSVIYLQPSEGKQLNYIYNEKEILMKSIIDEKLSATKKEIIKGLNFLFD